MSGSFLNLDIFQKMIGQDCLEYCTLMTTHWHTHKYPNKGEQNETQLRTGDRCWKPMLSGQSPARIARFENSRESAWKILMPLLCRRFVPAIDREMTASSRMTLEQSRAGSHLKSTFNTKIDKDIAAARTAHESQRKAESKKEKDDGNKVLGQEYYAERGATYVKEQKRLRRRRQAHKFVRYTLRAGPAGGAVTATVVASVLAFATHGALAPLAIAVAALGTDFIVASEVYANEKTEMDAEDLKASNQHYRKGSEAGPDDEWIEYQKKHTG